MKKHDDGEAYKMRLDAMGAEKEGDVELALINDNLLIREDPVHWSEAPHMHTPHAHACMVCCQLLEDIILVADTPRVACGTL